MMAVFQMKHPGAIFGALISPLFFATMAYAEQVPVDSRRGDSFHGILVAAILCLVGYGPIPFVVHLFRSLVASIGHR